MIEFRGEVSKKARSFIKRKESKSNMFALTFGCVIVGIPAIIFMTMWHKWTLFLTAPCLVVYYVMAYMFTNISDFIPQRIVITHDGTIKSECKETIAVQHVSKVKKVTDMGEFYHISFGLLIGNGRFVCQKNLLARGSLEEFEKMFDGKLKKGKRIRKKSKQSMESMTNVYSQSYQSESIVIEFGGEITGTCERYVNKKTLASGLTKMIICAIVGFPAAVGVAQLVDIRTLLISIPCVLFMMVICCLQLKKKNPNSMSICISIDGKIIEKGRDIYRIFWIADVSKVVDMGEWYVIAFEKHRGNELVCPKKCIVHGAIEEFESLFEGKIVRNKWVDT